MAEHATHDEEAAPLWGVAAEFETADGMVAALEALRDRDFGRLDAFSPVPIPEAAEAMRLTRRRMRPYAFAGAVVGAAAMFGMCTYGSIWGYKFNIGGRPTFSWPSFVVPSFSFAMLAGTLTIILMLLVLNRLPRLNHPAFNIQDFGRVTNDRFFIAVEARSAMFDPDAIEAVLERLPLRPYRVSRVPR